VNKNICDFIITESEKYAAVHSWTNNRHAHYPTTDIPVKRIKNIQVLVDNIVKYDILPLFEKYYNISKYFLEYNDLFIVKYDKNAQNKLEKHRDGSLFSFNVLLNDPNEFVGGGTIFEINGEDILVNNTKGGVVIHSGKLLHSGNEITEGKRYLLVGFIKYLGDF
jgi:predicted 2-oxoglutarate/Fe(II)-dependent dioxygenase YbiX